MYSFEIGTQQSPLKDTTTLCEMNAATLVEANLAPTSVEMNSVGMNAASSVEMNMATSVETNAPTLVEMNAAPTLARSYSFSTTLAKVLKECQATISYVCYELVMQEGSMTDAQQCTTVQNLYRGTDNPNIIKQSTAFIEGSGNYSSMYDVDETTGLKQIRSELTQETTSIFYVAMYEGDVDENKKKRTITLSLLNAKAPGSTEPISGRTIRENGMKVLANCRLAVSFGKQFFDSSGNLPSGKNHTDFYNYVLDEMHTKIVLEKKIKEKKITDAREREVILSTKRPTNWTFQGWMSFVLFGPLAREEFLMSELMRTGTVSVTFITYIVDNSLRLNLPLLC
jgi:hypothetical protein